MPKSKLKSTKDNKGQDIKQADDIKSDFISIASHQLRTPIAAVRWSLDTLLSGRTGTLSAKQQEVVAEAYQNNQFMVKVVNDLLRVSRIEEKGITLAPEMTDVASMVTEVIGSFQDIAKAYNCQVILKRQASAARYPAYIDRVQIKTVTESLIDNAIRYSRGKNNVTISFKQDKKFLVLVISDHGIGIAAADQKLVFSKFFRGDNAVKTQPEGLGLDLYMAKKIIDSSGGKIEFSSQRNKGTTFKIFLPADKVAVDTVKVTKSQEDQASQELKKEREFVSITVHELKAPLNVAKWSLEMLQNKKVGSLNKEQLELVSQVYRGNERLLVLVRDLLNLAKLQEGQFEITPKSMSLVRVVTDVVKGFATTSAEKKLTVVWKPSPRSLPPVLADQARVAQVVTNLVSNAVKYTPGGGRVEIKVALTTGQQLKTISRQSETINITNITNPKGYLVFSVSDTGIGISQKDQTRLFTRFFRSSVVLKSEAEGTGLGLYITKSIVNLHHGDIWFTSQLGKGSTFYFSLPVTD